MNQECSVFNKILDKITSVERLWLEANSTNDIEEFTILLDTIHHLISERGSEKLNIPLKQIMELHDKYDKRDRAYEILKKVLNITQIQAIQVSEWQQLFDTFKKLLDNTDTDFKAIETTLFMILSCCRYNNNFIDSFIVNLDMDNLYKYLCISSANDYNRQMRLDIILLFSEVMPNMFTLRLLNTLFKSYLEEQYLESLCYIFKQIEDIIILNYKNSPLEKEWYWDHLLAYVSLSGNYALQKQSSYLLSRSIDLIIKNSVENPHVPLQVSINIWDNFFILVDVSKEKQLHLLQPALKLIKTLKSLPFEWQHCIYKIFLNHNQNLIVYAVITHILQNLSDKHNIKSVISLLVPVITGQYYENPNTNELKILFKKLDQHNFNYLLSELINSSKWTSITMWYILKCLLTSCNHPINSQDYQKLMNCIQATTNIYIRTSCKQLLTKYFVMTYNEPNNIIEIFRDAWIIREKSDYNYDINEMFLKKVRTNAPQASNTDLEAIISTNIEHYDKFKYLFDFFCIELKLDSITPLLYNSIQKLNLETHPNAILVTDTDGVSNRDPIALLSKLISSVHDNSSPIAEDIVLYFSIRMDNSKYLELLQAASKKTDNCVTYFILESIIFKINKLNSSFFLEPFRIMVEKILSNSSNLLNDDKVICAFIRAYLQFDKYCFSEKNWLQFITLLSDVLETRGDTCIEQIYESLLPLVFVGKPETAVTKLIEDCGYNLLLIKKKDIFKKCVNKFIECWYSKTYYQLINHDLPKLVAFNRLLFQLSETYQFVGWELSHRIMEYLKFAEITEETVHKSFISVVINIYLQGVIVSKQERMEYMVYQDISKTLEVEQTDLLKSPNISAMKTKVNCLNCFGCLLKDTSGAIYEYFYDELIEVYSRDSRKRYFPNSELHIRKLRITELFLATYSLKSSTPNIRSKLIKFIIDSFLNEVHQSCVRQLMQWLLIRVLSDEEDDKWREVIKIPIDESSKTTPSSITALIPVLYHVLTDRQDNMEEVFQTLLTWCMGPQFKLRVYSQIALRNFYKHLESDCGDMISLHKSIEACIKASVSAFNDALKTDLVFFDSLEPSNHLSTHTIFVEIPRLNGVMACEWENLASKDLIDKIEMFDNTRHPIFSDAVDKYLKSIENNQVPATQVDIDDSYLNIQKKITPWKNRINSEDMSRTSNSDLILITSLITKPQNLGGLTRTCEVFGVKHMVVNTSHIVNNEEFKSLSMNSEHLVDIIEVKACELVDYFGHLKNDGYTLIGAEQTSNSVMLNSFTFPKKVAVLLGHEKQGIPPNLLSHLNMSVEIPQYGYVRSLNVHVAGAMFIWEYAKQHLS